MDVLQWPTSVESVRPVAALLCVIDHLANALLEVGAGRRQVAYAAAGPAAAGETSAERRAEFRGIGAVVKIQGALALA